MRASIDYLQFAVILRMAMIINVPLECHWNVPLDEWSL